MAKKRYDYGKDSTRNSGSRHRPGGAGGGVCESRACHTAECAGDHPQSADGAAAGGPAGVRPAVGAGLRHAGGGGGGPARCGGGAGHECAQSVYPPQPQLCRSRRSGLQPCAGGRRGFGGSGVRRGASRGAAVDGLVCGDTACRVRSRRRHLLRTRHPVSLQHGLCLSVCLRAGVGRRGAEHAGAAARGGGVADAAVVLGWERGAAVRLCVGQGGRVLAECVAGAAAGGCRSGRGGARCGRHGCR